MLTEQAEATGLAIARNRRPGSCVQGLPPGGFKGKELARSGESDSEGLAGSAPAAVERETRKEESARESGYGSPGRESSGGTFQGRERHERRPRSVGGHGERRGRKASSEPRAGRNRREGQEP